jgi:hypothetical protein
MADSPELLQEIADANRHIVEAHARIACQAEVVRKLDTDGHDMTEAESLLRTMEETVEAVQARRKHIVRELSCARDAQR